MLGPEVLKTPGYPEEGQEAEAPTHQQDLHKIGFTVLKVLCAVTPMAPHQVRMDALVVCVIPNKKAIVIYIVCLSKCVPVPVSKVCVPAPHSSHRSKWQEKSFV